MHIREAIQSDYEHLTDNSISMGCYRELPERIHYAYALEDRNRPIMLGGIILMTPTTAWCWMDWTQEAKDRARDSYRIVRDWLDVTAKEDNIKRLMAAVRTDFEAAINTVKHLGFTREATMKSFFNDDDAYLYVRIR